MPDTGILRCMGDSIDEDRKPALLLQRYTRGTTFQMQDLARRATTKVRNVNLPVLKALRSE